MHALLTKDEPSLQMHESNLKLNQKIWGGGGTISSWIQHFISTAG